MSKAIQQSVTLPASPQELYRTFLNSAKHAAATGAPAKTSAKVSGRFTAHGDVLRGRNLLLVPGKMIVQSWQAKHWKATDADSILILYFSKARGGGRIDLVHANVPAHDQKGVTQGWPKYYWKPWKTYLRNRKKS